MIAPVGHPLFLKWAAHPNKKYVRLCLIQRFDDLWVSIVSIESVVAMNVEIGVLGLENRCCLMGHSRFSTNPCNFPASFSLFSELPDPVSSCDSRWKGLSEELGTESDALTVAVADVDALKKAGERGIFCGEVGHVNI